MEKHRREALIRDGRYNFIKPPISNIMLVGSSSMSYFALRNGKRPLLKSVLIGLTFTLGLCEIIMRKNRDPTYFEYYTEQEYQSLLE